MLLGTETTATGNEAFLRIKIILVDSNAMELEYFITYCYTWSKQQHIV